MPKRSDGGGASGLGQHPHPGERSKAARASHCDVHPIARRTHGLRRGAMLDLGTYPLHAIADMFTFDMTTHLRYDIIAPRGPITRELPPIDNARLTPSMSCLLG